MADCFEGQLLNRTVSTPAIDHLGWAVRSIDSSRAHFESGLGLGMQSDERFPDVRVAFFGNGPTRVELLEPLSEDEVRQFHAMLTRIAVRDPDLAAYCLPPVPSSP